MAQQANMRFIRNLLYKLKRQYGAKVTIYETLSEEINSKTGLKSSIRKPHQIQLAIVLPDTLARKFAYEHSFLAANRAFTYGAQWDQGQRVVIVDSQDIPKNFQFEIDSDIVFENQRYTVKTAQLLDIGFGSILTIIKSQSNLPLQVFELKLKQKLGFGQSSGAA